MTTRLPKLVAFDLDYTLWPLWIDTHVTPPLRREGDELNAVQDQYNNRISFYHEVPQILHRLQSAGVIVAACSRTSAPELARKGALPPPRPPRAGDKHGPVKPAIEFFDEMEIYPGSKLTHFRKLQQKTGIPYSEMLFFDDEHRNKEVETLGVTFALVRKDFTERTFEEGLAGWRKRHPAEVTEDAGGDDVKGI